MSGSSRSFKRALYNEDQTKLREQLVFLMLLLYVENVSGLLVAAALNSADVIAYMLYNLSAIPHECQEDCHYLYNCEKYSLL